MIDLDQLCVCGARYGDHGAPNPWCPAGDEFTRERFEATPGTRKRPQTTRESLLAAARVGVQPRWRPEFAPGEHGAEEVRGWTLANRDEVEDAERRWKATLRSQAPQDTDAAAFQRLVGEIGE